MDDDNTINELALILVRVGRKNYSDDAKFEAQYENDSSDDLLMESTLSSREMHPEHDPVDGRSEDQWASVDGGSVLPREAPIVYERRRSIEVRDASFRENDPSFSYGAGNRLSGFSKYICKLRRKKRFAWRFARIKPCRRAPAAKRRKGCSPGSSGPERSRTGITWARSSATR